MPAVADDGMTGLAARLAGYAFDVPDDPVPFTARLRGQYGWNDRFVRRVIDEYRRFILLAATGNAASVPSAAIDRVWHLHLLDTRRYWDDFCPNTLGAPLHHTPSRGGEAEAERHATLYHATLDRYAVVFGEAPPPDIWPDDRRATAPRFSLRLLFARFAGVATLAGMAGCATLYDSSQPGAIQGPDFLRIYLMIWFVALALLALLLGVGQTDAAAPTSAGSLDPEATAFLAGGAARAIQTAQLRLLRDGLLGLDPKRRTLISSGRPPPDATPLQVAVHRAADLRSGSGRQDVRAALASLREGLVEQGLIPDAAERSRKIRLAILLAGPVFALGVVRACFGVANGRPVALLVVELVAAAIACLVLLRWRLSATPAGRRLLREARSATERSRRDAADPGLLTAMALFGSAVLSPMDFGGYRAYLSQAGSGGDGGGGGSCGGGGCGGGGCGG
jgi:uncharacterized protein (TIGR04222 family)